MCTIEDSGGILCAYQVSSWLVEAYKLLQEYIDKMLHSHIYLTGSVLQEIIGIWHSLILDVMYFLI
jgi:hypothetical protein